MIPMRSAIIIFVVSLLACVVFLKSPAVNNHNQAFYSSDNNGRVLGAEEAAAEISLNDLGLSINTLPASEVKTIKAP